MKPEILKPSRVMRLTKANKLPSLIDGGKINCQKCGKRIVGDTESPTYWENGTYVWCEHCGQYCLARPVYPAVSNYPHGIVIDLRGERKKYSVTMQ
jgi:DNA-directed RNA polymerase subunit RPC12/RpoP